MCINIYTQVFPLISHNQSSTWCHIYFLTCSYMKLQFVSKLFYGFELCLISGKLSISVPNLGFAIVLHISLSIYVSIFKVNFRNCLSNSLEKTSRNLLNSIDSWFNVKTHNVTLFLLINIIYFYYFVCGFKVFNVQYKFDG